MCILNLTTPEVMRKIMAVLLAAFILMNGSDIALASDKQQYPQVVLTLNDSTVIIGCLRSNLHDVDNNVSVSSTCDGKKISYKIADINSLKVTYADGRDETYIPIHTWDKYSKKVNKNPILATVCFSGNHVVGYRIPSQYIKSSAAVPSSNFQSYSWYYDAWIFCYQADNSGIIKDFWVHIPVKKAPKLKSIIKNVKKNFKDYPIVAETIESDCLTADTIIQNPCILLEILDKNLR